MLSQNNQKTNTSKIPDLYSLMSRVGELKKEILTLEKRLINQKAFGELTCMENIDDGLELTKREINHAIVLYYIYENTSKECFTINIEELMNTEINSIKSNLNYYIARIDSAITLDVRESIYDLVLC